MKREGSGRAVFDSVCKYGTTTATTRGVFVGDPSSRYTFESKTTFDPPMGGIKEGVTKGTGQWMGPCTAGMKPGDIVLPNGSRFNINDARKAAGK